MKHPRRWNNKWTDLLGSLHSSRTRKAKITIVVLKMNSRVALSSSLSLRQAVHPTTLINLRQRTTHHSAGSFCHNKSRDQHTIKSIIQLINTRHLHTTKLSSEEKEHKMAEADLTFTLASCYQRLYSILIFAFYFLNWICNQFRFPEVNY